MCGGRSKKRR